MSVGQPAHIKLNLFGDLIRAAYGEIPYHVGSSVESKTWRDVDVRLILGDEEFRGRYGALEGEAGYNGPKWMAECLAFATLGKEMTGLPIDFQIQARTEANKKYEGLRSALFVAASIFDSPAMKSGRKPQGGIAIPFPKERCECGKDRYFRVSIDAEKGAGSLACANCGRILSSTADGPMPPSGGQGIG